MNNISQFYDYERCFKHYTERIMNLRQARIYGEVIMAKPILLLALIDSIDGGEFTSNNFRLTDRLEECYFALMRRYVRGSQFDNPTPIATPFYHLQGDGFWHLSWRTGTEPKSSSKSPSRKYICDNCLRAAVDDDLWALLENGVMRLRLREYIVTHKLGNDRDKTFDTDLCSTLPKAAEEVSGTYGISLAA